VDTKDIQDKGTLGTKLRAHMARKKMYFFHLSLREQLKRYQSPYLASAGEIGFLRDED